MKPNRKEYIVNDKPSPCPECPEYKTCRQLCERAERWVNQDSIGGNSNVVLENGSDGNSLFNHGHDFLDIVDLVNDPPRNELDSTVSQDAWNRINEMRLSEKVSRFIYSYYMLGKRIRDIAIDEKASSQAIDKRHVQAKISIRNRLKRLELWKNHVDAMEFKSIRHYDMCVLFFTLFYPRMIISKVVGAHTSTVINETSNKINQLSKD
jgi:hypothetical protein